MNELERFGQNVKYYRKKKGMTQTDLANATGYKRGGIASIEIGRANVPYSKIELFAKVLDCTPGDLVDWESAERTAYEQRILTYLKYLNPEAMKKLEDIIIDYTSMPKYRKDFKKDDD